MASLPHGASWTWSRIPESTFQIVALTANVFPEDRRRRLDAGVDEFLSKPFPEDAIVDVLSRVCHR